MSQQENPIANRRVAFAGKLGSMTLREAAALVRRLGGVPVQRDSGRVDLLITGVEGAASPTANDSDTTPPESISEVDLWRRLGVVPEAEAVRKLCTPAMLSRFVGVPTSTIRLWQKRGWIEATEQVHRLPYYEFQEVIVAKKLAELVRSGLRPAEINQQLERLREQFGDVARPLAESGLLIDGKHVLIRRGEDLLESTGQKRLQLSTEENDSAVNLLQMPIGDASSDKNQLDPVHLVASAEAYEEQADFASAAELYRAALAAGGANADYCFALAECLYQLGETAAARERYEMAIELDDTFLEARANLGCVLAELGHPQLAIAALEGALHLHPSYADAHFHLARLYELTGEQGLAIEHQSQYETLSPKSPWNGRESPDDVLDE